MGWYGESLAQANVLALGDSSWGSNFDISCDGNAIDPPLVTVQGNLVLSDESSRSHQPDADFVDQYIKVYETVCAASHRAQAPSKDFLSSLNKLITKLGGSSRTCDGPLAHITAVV